MRSLFVLLFGLFLTPPIFAQDLRLPMKDGSTRFAIIGDTGTGGSEQIQVGKQLMAWRSRFPFEFILMVGDNLYGNERPSDYVKKFEQPYKALLDGGVKFYAALGNHDEPTQRLYKPFNMNGERYYSFKPSLTGGVRFFALDSNYMDQAQLNWLKKELAASGSEWKIPFFHHPLYSSSRKRDPNSALRDQLEPIFVAQGVNVVFMGHEHFYERIKPQKGIAYFIAGNAAKLRPGDIDTRSGLTIKGFDRGYAFMLVEISGDQLYFQTISEKGQTVDYGVITKGDNNRVVGTTGPARAPAPTPAAPKPAPTAPSPGR